MLTITPLMWLIEKGQVNHILLHSIKTHQRLHGRLKSMRSYICVLGVSLLPLSMILILNF